MQKPKKLEIFNIPIQGYITNDNEPIKVKSEIFLQFTNIKKVNVYQLKIFKIFTYLLTLFIVRKCYSIIMTTNLNTYGQYFTY